MRAADHAFGEADVFRMTALVELNENGMRESIDARIETTNAVAQAFGQHRDHAVRKINAVSAPAGFAIERAVGTHISRNVSNVNSESPALVVGLVHMNRVVKIARVIRVDGDNEFFSQILTAFEHPRIDGFGNPIRFIDNCARKFGRQIILPNDREHIDARSGGRSEQFDDLALRINVPRFPRLQSNHDLVAAARSLRQLRARRKLNVNIVNKTRIIRNDVIKVPRVLKRAHDRIARAFQDSNDTAFLPPTSIFRARISFLARDARNHAVAVHGRAGVFRGDKNVRLAWSFDNEEAVAGLMDRQCAGDKIGFGRQNVTILANARDLAGAFQLTQNFAQGDSFAAGQIELARDVDLIEWPVVFPSEKRANLFSNFTSVLSHASESILSTRLSM